jgi:23S rRNA (uracil1939-C5)-methyltransferase
MEGPLLKPGQVIPLHLDSLAIGGECVGRYQGMAVFATWGCPGDEAEVEITEVAARFARGVVRKVLSPSPDRVPAPCPHFGDCGGCQLQHTAYQAQLRHKTALVRDAVSRLAGLSDVEVAEAWAMQDPWRYRGRAEYHAVVDSSGQLVLGFARHHSHDIFALRECALQHPLSEQARVALLDLMPRVAQGGAERAALYGLETLASYATGEAIATLVCEGRPPFLASLAESLMSAVPGLAGVCAARQRGRGSPHRSPSELIHGKSHLVERLGDGSYRVSPDSFFQVNPRQGARIVSLVTEWAGVGPGDVVLDAYCGVGALLLPLARRARQAAGVEADEAALADARANLRRWRLKGVTLYQGRVERVLPRLGERGFRADVVVLDPPRKGCGPVVCEAAARLRPRRILLVSCHPATLARDLKLLAGHGYPARRLQPVDMFPQTWHVEAVAVCERAL